MYSFAQTALKSKSYDERNLERFIGFNDNVLLNLAWCRGYFDKDRYCWL